MNLIHFLNTNRSEYSPNDANGEWVFGTPHVFRQKVPKLNNRVHGRDQHIAQLYAL